MSNGIQVSANDMIGLTGSELSEVESLSNEAFQLEEMAHKKRVSIAKIIQGSVLRFSKERDSKVSKQSEAKNEIPFKKKGTKKATKK